MIFGNNCTVFVKDKFIPLPTAPIALLSANSLAYEEELYLIRISISIV
jgi:hypothetical protein